MFRALCKLTMKSLATERYAPIQLINCWRIWLMLLLSERDLKSHAMRSKLLSLHLVLTVLNSHMPLFVSPSAIIHSTSSNEATTFVQAVNQYLCLSLSRNAVSAVPQVFEISVEIFWRVLSGMRTKLKVRSSSILASLESLTAMSLPERDRGASARDLHPYLRDENGDPQAKGHHSGNVLSPLPGTSSIGRDIPQLRLRQQCRRQYL